MNNYKTSIPSWLSLLNDNTAVNECIAEIKSMPDSKGDSLIKIKSSADDFVDLCKKAAVSDREQVTYTLSTPWYALPEPWMPAAADIANLKNFQSLVMTYEDTRLENDPVIKLKNLQAFKHLGQLLSEEKGLQR